MNEETQQDEVLSPVVSMSKQQVLQVGLIGIVVGLLTWGIAFLLDIYALKAVFCHGAAAAQCVATPQYAQIIGTLIAAAAGLFGLVKLRIFRPLLVVIASTVALWGLVGIVTPFFPWYGVGLICVGFYLLSYLAFAWIARIRIFWIAVLLLVILIVAMRLLLMS